MLRRNLIANYVGQGWTALMGLAFIPLYIRYLGIEAFGLIGLFALLQAWLALLDMGMRPTLVREMARFTAGIHTAQFIRDLLRSVEVVTLGVAFLLFVAVFAASGWLASSWLRVEALPLPEVAQAISIMAAVAALRFVEGIYGSSLVGLQRQVTFNLIGAGMATLRGLGAVAVLAWISPTLRAFFAWQGLVSALSLVLMALATYSSLPGSAGGRWSTEAMRTVWRFAGGMIGITFLALLLTQVDKILLSRLLTLHEYGHYVLAATVAGGLYMLVSPIAQAWYPRLSALHAAGEHAALARVYHQGAQLVTVILGSVAVVLVVFAGPILNLWIRDTALADRTAPLLALLALGNLLNGLMWIPYQTQLAFGWTGLMIRINIVAVLVIVPAILWVTPRYGSLGAAAVWVTLNAGYLVIGVQFMYRRVLSDEKRRWYLEDVLWPLSAASTVALVLRWVLPIPESAALQAIGLLLAFALVLLAATLAAPLLYGAANSALSHMLRGRHSGGRSP